MKEKLIELLFVIFLFMLETLLLGCAIMLLVNYLGIDLSYKDSCAVFVLSRILLFKPHIFEDKQ